MEITFNLPVIVRGKPGRAANVRTVVATVPVVVDVPSYTREEAPTVLRYRETRRLDLADRRENEGAYGVRETALAGVEGVLYGETGHVWDGKPVFHTFHRDLYPYPSPLFRDVDMAIRELEDGDVERELVGNLRETLKHRRGSCVFETLADMNVRGDIARSVEEQVAAFRKHASRFVLVDGSFMMSEPEPLIRLSDGVGNGVRSTVLRRPWGDPPRAQAETGIVLGSVGFFRMTDLDAMREEAGALAAAVGGLFQDYVHEVDILDPSYFTADAEGLSLREVAIAFRQYFLPGFHEVGDSEHEAFLRISRRLQRLPVAQLLLFQDLADGIDAYREHAMPEALEAAVSRVLETDGVERHYFLYTGNVEKFSREILRRWNDRTVSLDFDVEPRHLI